MGDKVGIKLESVKKKLTKENYLNIESFDKYNNKVHIISNVYQSFIGKNKTSYRYELNSKYVFYEDELYLK